MTTKIIHIKKHTTKKKKKKEYNLYQATETTTSAV